MSEVLFMFAWMFVGFWAGWMLHDWLARNLVAKQGELIACLKKELAATKACYAGCDIGLRRLQERLDEKEKKLKDMREVADRLAVELNKAEQERDEIYQKLKIKDELYLDIMERTFRVSDLLRIEDEANNE